MALTLTIGAVNQTSKVAARSMSLKFNTFDLALLDPATIPDVDDALTLTDPAWSGTIKSVKITDTAEKGAHITVTLVAANEDVLADDTAPFGISDTPNNSTTFGYKHLSVTVARTRDDTLETIGTCTILEPGLIPGMMLPVTSANRGYSADEFLLTNVVTFWPLGKEASPQFALTFGSSIVTFTDWIGQVGGSAVITPVTLVQFDDFNRVISSHFGSTDYGIGWLYTPGFGSADVYFDGTTGVGEFFIEDSAVPPTVTTAEGDGGPWVDSPQWTMRCRFKLVDFPRAMNIAIVNPLGGSIGVQVGGDSGDTFLISDVVDDTNAVGDTVFVEDVWYIVELYYNPGVMLAAKVWQEGESAPGSYQISGVPDATISSDSYFYLHPNELAEERTVQIDYIHFFTQAGVAVTPLIPFQWEFHRAGTLTVATNVAEYFLTPYNCIIDDVWIHDSAFPLVQDIIIDVNANGTTIFTTQANRPHIAVSFNGGRSGYPDGGAAVGDNVPITVDVDQIGVGTVGADLTVLVRGRYRG